MLHQLPYVSILAAMLFCVPVFGQAPQSAALPDYSAELPRIPPLKPDAAQQHFELQSGFAIEQAAAEPLVTDPVAMSFDANGRLYVVEMRDYSEQDTERLGQVRLLEDTNGDGRFDKSSVFADDLSWPTAIICYDGGVFVGAAPHLYFLKDTDDDQQADERRIVFTGFHRSNVQGLMNSFRWGLDNRIHGATSSSGADVVRPDVAGFEPIVLRRRDFSFDPKTLDLRPESGGAQHGMCFDDWGRKFVCSNSDHAQYVVFDDRYLARNPLLSAPRATVSIADDGGQAPVYRASPVEPWRIVRTRLRVSGAVKGVVEGGGRPAGYFTGATGITIYRGDAFPEDIKGTAVIGDVGSNIVHRKRLVPDGVLFTATRIDEKSEFVRSDDIWFRPVQFANAPDGCLYILDMYREVIEHPKSLPPEIKMHLDLTSGRNRGRLYRVVPAGKTVRKPPKLEEASSAELVELLSHPNSWQRETASRLLYERQDQSVVQSLVNLAEGGDAPLGRLHALHVLQGLDQLNAETVAHALQDQHPGVREQALQLAESFPQSQAVRDAIAPLTNDDEIRVRFQLAFSVGEFPVAWRLPVLEKVMKNDGDNPWIRLAAMSSLGQGARELFVKLFDDADWRDSQVAVPVLNELIGQLARSSSPEEISQLLVRIAQLPKEETPLQVRLISQLLRSNRSLRSQFESGAPHRFLQEILSQARTTLDDGAASLTARVAAIRALPLGLEQSDIDRLLELLETSEPTSIQSAALDALAEYSTPEVAAGVLARWPRLTPSIRTQAEELLFSRTPWTQAVLDAIEAQQLAVSDISPARLQILKTSRNAEIRGRAQKLLKSTRSVPRQAIVEKYQSALDLPGDVARGRELFRKECASCHRLEEHGHQIGPNLATIQNRGKETILLNVLDPNREVNPEYLSFVVATADGRAYSGMIQAESANSITLVRAEKKSDTILRGEIEQIKSSGLSLMPEGLEKQIDEQGMADVIAYLMSIR